ncbi:hypothetical protein RI367_008689, partial [Sorochytrium milnesiophthora]
TEPGIQIAIPASIDADDDAAWLAKDTTAMSRMVQRIETFNVMTGIRANAKKGVMIVVNQPCGPHLPVAIGTEEVPTLVRKTTERYLGVWLAADSSSRKLSDHVLAPIRSACEQLSSKRVTARQAVYVLRHVAIPQMLYRTKGCIPTAAQLDIAQRWMRKCIKRSVGISLDTPSAIVEHDDLLGLPPEHYVSSP